MENLILSVVLTTILFKGSQQSRFNLCFDWRVSANELALNCRAHYLDHRIAIIDPVGITQAECVPPFSEMSCDTHNSNGTIRQKRRTNETFYVLKGTIDYHLNGNWTCRHGKNLDSAKVEVTVFKPSGEEQSSKHPECLFTVFVTGCIFLVSAACAQIWVFCMLLIPQNWTILGIKLFSLEAALGKCCRLPDDYQRKDDYIAILKRISFFICATIFFIIINIPAVGSNCINVFLPISGVFAGFICSLTCLGKKSTGNYSEFGNNQVILDNDIPLVEEETN